MSEREPQPDDLDRITLDGRSLRAWHEWLLRDPVTGELDSDMAVPCSRYGRTAGQVAWFAIATELSFELLGGDTDDFEAAVEFHMSSVVNDAPEPAAMISVMWPELPSALRAQLGELEDVTAMMSD